MVNKFLILTVSLLSLFILNSVSFSEPIQMFKDEAVKYRLEGLAAQQRGNFDKALELFQKAISIDPAYALAHNDLGIIYEEKGWLERAESEYLEAIKIDTNYLPAYTNLAFLYESMGEIEKAIRYWRQRASLGLDDDPWTLKAKENLKRLNAPLQEPVVIDEDRGLALERELLEEVEEFSKSVALDRELNLQQIQVKFEEHKSKGDAYLAEGKIDLALEEFRAARNIQPLDEEINLLIEEAEAKYAENLIKDYFNNGLKCYQQGNFSQANLEFRKILNVVSTILEEQEREKTCVAPTD